MKQLKVLFCDDQPEIHIATALQQADCHFLGKVDSPKKLFEYLHAHPKDVPDVLFLDARFNTREIDQQFNELQDTLAELNAYPEWRKIRVVILTGVPIREMFELTFPYIKGFIDKADYQRAINDALTVFTYGDEDATFFNKFSPWKPRKNIGEIWNQFTDLQLSILDDCLRGHSDEFIQTKHGMRNHSNLTGRMDYILQKLIELSKNKAFYLNFGDMSKGGLSIRQKFWVMLQICIELKHPTAQELWDKNTL
jgi:hypothetical protein